MPNRPRIALVILLAFSTAAHAAAGDLAARIEAYVAPFVEAEHLSGSITLARGDEILFERGYNLANRELGVANTPTTRFCVASITKPMTQIIALRLLAEERLALDDKLSEWIPDFPRASTITVEMLARHRAGIPHRVTTGIEETVPRTAADMVDMAKKAELLFEPGRDTSYSSAGYSVLARVLELVAGKSYSELLEDHVFAPAGMVHSLHPAGSELIPRRASSYQLAGRGELLNAPLKDYSFLVGAGSVFATSGDLVRLMRAVVEGRYGSLVVDQLMDEKGLDWNGRTNGYRAFADYHAEADLYVAFTSNILTGVGDLLRRDLPRLVAGESVTPPTVPDTRSVTIDVSALRAYEGDYELQPGNPLALTVEDGEVRVGDWLLLPTSETTFFSPQDYGEVTVVEGEDGAVERLDWKVGGETYPMPRVGD